MGMLIAVAVILGLAVLGVKLQAWRWEAGRARMLEESNERLWQDNVTLQDELAGLTCRNDRLVNLHQELYRQKEAFLLQHQTALQQLAESQQRVEEVKAWLNRRT